MELTYTDGNLTVTITGTIEDAITIMGRSFGFTAHWHQPTTEPTRTGTATGWTAWAAPIDITDVHIHAVDCTCPLSAYHRVAWSRTGETLTAFFQGVGARTGVKAVTISHCC